MKHGWLILDWTLRNYFFHQNTKFLSRKKANLRDLIAASGPVILLQLDSNRPLISPCDLEIWWMTSKTNKASLLYYIKLCTSFQIHRWIQTGVTAWKRSIRVKIGDFFCPVWPWNLMDDLEKKIGRIFYTILSFVQHFKAIGKGGCRWGRTEREPPLKFFQIRFI